jgi:hypothetical protein
MLAEIIVSPKVGGLHLQRVREFLVAREHMNLWMADRIKSALANAQSSGIFRHARCGLNRMASIARAVLTLERHR